MKLEPINIRDIRLENVGEWPNTFKGIVIVVSCLILLGIAYWFDIKTQLQKLQVARAQELVLRQDFEKKQLTASNLGAYKAQLAEMNKLFAAMLRQLPSSAEVPGLLEDISKTGTANGLEFRLFKPLAEKQEGFLVELPIQITVVGDYHQIAQFVNQVASFDRIVTLNDFTIKPINLSNTDQSRVTVENNGKLQMDVMAKTYRYYGESEPKVANKPQTTQATQTTTK